MSILNYKKVYKHTLAAMLMVCSISACAATDDVAFFRSAQVDDTWTVKKLLDKGVDPNTTEPNRGDPMMVLALREDANKVFQLLLAQPGINLEARSNNGDTALMMASYKHNKPAVMALLAKGAHVNQSGWTALHYAAAAGDDEIVRILLGRQAAIDARSPDQITPLMFAAREGQDRIVALLLASGADASLVSVHGWTAAQFAQAADKPKIAATLDAHLRARAVK